LLQCELSHERAEPSAKYQGYEWCDSNLSHERFALERLPSGDVQVSHLYLRLYLKLGYEPNLRVEPMYHVSHNLPT